MLQFFKSFYVGLSHDENGNFNNTRFWASVAYFTATFIVIKLTYLNQLTENYFLIYLGVVAAHGTASKFINTKTNNNNVKD